MIYANYEELIKEHQIPIYSDLFEFVKLYKRFEIECKISDCDEGFRICLFIPDGPSEQGKTIHPKIMSDFRGEHQTSIHFDKDGKFIKQNILY